MRELGSSNGIEPSELAGTQTHLVSPLPTDGSVPVDQVPRGASAAGRDFLEPAFKEAVVLRVVLEEAQVAVLGEVADLLLQLLVPFPEVFGALKECWTRKDKNLEPWISLPFHMLLFSLR